MIIIGDFYLAGTNLTADALRFVPHPTDDIGTPQSMLRQMDRRETSRAIAVGMERLYQRKIRGAVAAGVDTNRIEALGQEMRQVLRSVRGWRPRAGFYRLDFSIDGPLQWEGRRLRDCAQLPMRIAFGFERAMPHHNEPL